MTGVCIVCGTISERLVTCSLCGSQACEKCCFEGVCLNCVRGKQIGDQIHKR